MQARDLPSSCKCCTLSQRSMPIHTLHLIIQIQRFTRLTIFVNQRVMMVAIEAIISICKVPKKIGDTRSFLLFNTTQLSKEVCMSVTR